MKIIITSLLSIFALSSPVIAQVTWGNPTGYYPGKHTGAYSRRVNMYMRDILAYGAPLYQDLNRRLANVDISSALINQQISSILHGELQQFEEEFQWLNLLYTSSARLQRSTPNYSEKQELETLLQGLQQLLHNMYIPLRTKIHRIINERPDVIM